MEPSQGFPLTGLDDEQLQLLNQVWLATTRTPASFQEALITACDRPETRNAIREEIDSLRQVVSLLKLQFQSVRLKLKMLDGGMSCGSRQGNSSKIHSANFGSLWDTYRTRLDTLVSESRKIATQIAYCAKEFRTIVIDVVCDPNETKADKVKTLDHFVQSLSEYKVKFADNTTNFEALRLDIVRFCNKLKNTTADASATNQKSIQDISFHIAQIDLQMKKWKDFAVSSSWIMSGAGLVGSQAFGYATGAILSGVAITPVGWACIIAAALLATGAVVGNYLSEKKLEQFNVQLEEARGRLNMLSQADKELMAFKALVESIEKELGVVYSKLSVMSHIWSLLEQDATRLRKDIICENDEQNTLLSKHAFLLTKRVYGRLEDSFTMYAARIE